MVTVFLNNSSSESLNMDANEVFSQDPPPSRPKTPLRERSSNKQQLVPSLSEGVSQFAGSIMQDITNCLISHAQTINETLKNESHNVNATANANTGASNKEGCSLGDGIASDSGSRQGDIKPIEEKMDSLAEKKAKLLVILRETYDIVCDACKAASQDDTSMGEDSLLTKILLQAELLGFYICAWLETGILHISLAAPGAKVAISQYRQRHLRDDNVESLYRWIEMLADILMKHVEGMKNEDICLIVEKGIKDYIEWWNEYCENSVATETWKVAHRA